LATIRPNPSNMTSTNARDWSSNEIMDGRKRIDTLDKQSIIISHKFMPKNQAK
jgi:hypothetical protein